MAEDDLASLVHQLKALPEVVRACLAQKSVRHLKTRKHYLLAVDLQQPRGGESFVPADYAAGLAHLLRMPGTFHVVANDGTSDWLINKIIIQQQAVIYEEK